MQPDLSDYDRLDRAHAALVESARELSLAEALLPGVLEALRWESLSASYFRARFGTWTEQIGAAARTVEDARDRIRLQRDRVLWVPPAMQVMR